ILGLHEEHRISGFVHGLRTRSLVEFLSTDLPTTYKGLMEKTYTWIEAREVATNRAPNDHREGSNRIKKNSSRDNSKGKRNRDKFSLYRGVNHGLLSNLSKSPREILATKKIAKTFEQPPRMLESRRSHDMTKYCHFHEDHGHNTNDCHELRHQIKEGVKSRQFSHLMKITKCRLQVRSVVFLRRAFLAYRRGPPGDHNRRTTMQKMGIVVSMIHDAIKFHTLRKIGTILSIYEPDKVGEGHKKLRETSTEVTKGVLSCTDAEERIIINDKYPKHMVIIGKQLPTNSKEKLRDLLRSNVDEKEHFVTKDPFGLEEAELTYSVGCKGILSIKGNEILISLPQGEFKSISQENMLKDIQETFDRFRSINMKLNPKKCSFGVEESPFWGHLITKQGFDAYAIEHIRRNQNKKADALSKLALMTFEHLMKEVLVGVLAKRSINDKEVSRIEAEKEVKWMTPIYEYLLSGLLPEDPKEARKIRIKAPQYKLIKGRLYKKSFLTPWLC
ncbi:hypothetical protein Tco_1051210, partial [Tanacetum coccineum]